MPYCPMWCMYFHSSIERNKMGSFIFSYIHMCVVLWKTQCLGVWNSPRTVQPHYWKDVTWYKASTSFIKVSEPLEEIQEHWLLQPCTEIILGIPGSFSLGSSPRILLSFLLLINRYCSISSPKHSWDGLLVGDVSLHLSSVVLCLSSGAWISTHLSKTIGWSVMVVVVCPPSGEILVEDMFVIIITSVLVPAGPSTTRLSVPPLYTAPPSWSSLPPRHMVM